MPDGNLSSSSRFPTKKRLISLALRAGIFTLLALSAFYFTSLDGIFTQAKSVAEARGVYPNSAPTAAQPEEQTEPHTCGLHALRSLYRSHQLVPELYNLRFRLGTDRRAVDAVDTSQGTVQADLYRVLAQDGFHVVGLDLDAGHRRKVLMHHLSSGLKALALIRRPENGNLHWILLEVGEPQGLQVVDSLVIDPYSDSPEGFLDTKAVSIALVHPGSEGDLPSIKDAYRLGVAEMIKTPARVSALEGADDKG